MTLSHYENFDGDTHIFTILILKCYIEVKLSTMTHFEESHNFNHFATMLDKGYFSIIVLQECTLGEGGHFFFESLLNARDSRSLHK